jgi:ketosteroid isomerase-like protein
MMQDAQPLAPQVEAREIDVARAFNAAWNDGDVDRIMAYFVDDAVVRFVPTPAPPAPEILHGKDRIRAWVAEVLRSPFRIEATNYRVAGAVVTWAATFPSSNRDVTSGVSQLVFDGDRIREFVP